MSTLAAVLPLQDVPGDVRLRPPLVGLQGDQVLWSQGGDLSSATGRLSVLGSGGGR